MQLLQSLKIYMIDVCLSIQHWEYQDNGSSLLLGSLSVYVIDDFPQHWLQLHILLGFQSKFTAKHLKENNNQPNGET